jgi:hypothetical protein
MSQGKNEICSKCNKEIAHLEQAYVFEGQVICGQCDEQLRLASEKNILEGQNFIPKTTNQQKTPHDSNTSEDISYCPAPDGLRKFFEYQQFDRTMRPYSVVSIWGAIILGIIICGVLLGPANLPKKMNICYYFILAGAISTSSILGKKAINAISTLFWGCYSILIGVALTQVPKVFGIEEIPNGVIYRIILGTTLFVIIGLILFWTGISYLRKRSIWILLVQGICFAILSIVHILIIFFANVMFENTIIGLWLASLSLISFLLYRKLKGKSTEQPSRDTADFVNRIIQEVRTSRSENTPGIIEITGGGPVWIGKLWSDSLMFVVANDDDEVHFVSKSDFKLVKRWPSAASGFIRVRFKVDGQEYNGEVSGESYHRYQKWKSKCN